MPVLVEAIKTQQSQITTMKVTKDTEIAELNAQVQALTEAVK